MIVDAQLMMMARIFDGPLDSFRVRVGFQQVPSGMHKTHCNVPDEIGKCALVSRLWQATFREWHRKELEKVFEAMLVAALDGAFDLCDRDAYPFKGGVPLVSTLEHSLYLKGIKVFAVVFRRTGVKFRHGLTAQLSHDVPTGMVEVRKVWRVKTPLTGWKKMILMSEEEVDHFNAWVEVERKALHAWIRDVMGFDASPLVV